MTDLNLLCLTCLSSADDGARISESMDKFLREDLHFKCKIEENSRKLVCLKCYRTLIELRRFCTQLRDVELYFESKLITLPSTDEKDLVHEEYTTEIGVTEDDAEEMKLDPILIDECPLSMSDYQVVENKEVLRKSYEQAGEKKFMCLICSKLFSSIEDLRSHERTHPTKSNPSLPVVVPRKLRLPQKQKKLGCPDCGSRFDIMNDLVTHKKKHALDKLKPFRCFKCNRRFLTYEALRDHELVHIEVQMCQCEICHKRYLNQSSLDAHMRVSHNCSNQSETTEV